MWHSATTPIPGRWHGGSAHVLDTTDGELFGMDSTHGEPMGCVSMMQDPHMEWCISDRVVQDNIINYQFDLQWILNDASVSSVEIVVIVMSLTSQSQ